MFFFINTVCNDIPLMSPSLYVSIFDKLFPHLQLYNSLSDNCLHKVNYGTGEEIQRCQAAPLGFLGRRDSSSFAVLYHARLFFIAPLFIYIHLFK